MIGHLPTHRRRVVAVAGLLLAGALVALSCARSPTSPLGVPTLVGQVLDADGSPAAGARIAVTYSYVAAPRPSAAPTPVGEVPPPSGRTFRIRNNPCSAGSAILGFELPTAARCVGIVATRAGVTVRTLFDRSFAVGTYQLLWDGKDDSNLPVPADVYLVALHEDQGDSTFNFVRRLLWNQGDPAIAPQITADAEGKFVIPLSQFPFGEVIHAEDPNGIGLGNVTVSRELNFCATGPPGGNPATVCEPRVPANTAGLVAVELRLPYYRLAIPEHPQVR